MRGECDREELKVVDRRACLSKEEIERMAREAAGSPSVPTLENASLITTSIIFFVPFQRPSFISHIPSRYKRNVALYTSRFIIVCYKQLTA